MNQLTEAMASPTTTQSLATPIVVQTRGNKVSTYYAMEASSSDSKFINEKITTTSAVPASNDFTKTTDQSISAQGTNEQMTPRSGNANAESTTVSDGSISTEGKLTAGVYTTSSRVSASQSGKAHGSGNPAPRPNVPTVPALQTNGNYSGQSGNGTDKGRCTMKMIQVCENQPSQTPTPGKKNFWGSAEKEIQSLRTAPIICKTMDFSWRDWTKADCHTSHIALGLIASLIVMTIFALIALSDIFNVCVIKPRGK